MKRFSNILMVVDVDVDMDHTAALNRAVALAKNNQASLTLVGFIDQPITYSISMVVINEVRNIALNQKLKELNEMIETIDDSNFNVDKNVFVGKPYIEIIWQVLKNNYDLVIKCAKGRTGLSDVLFGSTNMHLMRKCPCPVWTIKSTERQQYRRILAAVDLDPEDEEKDALNRQILEMSTSLALSESSELHITHVWDVFGEEYLRSTEMVSTSDKVDKIITEEENMHRHWLEKLVDTYGVKKNKDSVDYLSPQLHIIRGNPKIIIPKKAQELDVDLIVMGTVARTGIAGFFMGNTAENILNQINCSVLTIKPPGFISPVKLEP